MKKTILFAILTLMTSLGCMAQEKGPAVIETENFSITIPKGWMVSRKSSGSISSVELVPETKPEPSTNFGYSIELWSFANSSYTVDKIIDEAMKQFGSNAKVEKKNDIKFGSNSFQQTFFDEGHGSYEVLALPLKETGAIRVAVSSYPVNNKDVKAILKSLKVNK